MASERPSMMMEKQNSVTMEYFLETSHLDADTAELLKKYDKDGNGSFSKDEVAAIIMDLREAMRSNQELGTSNKLFKRLLIASCVFCVLLLASMFGLSYAVAALTAKTDVDSSGALTKAGSLEHVSTDSRAEVHSVEVNEDGHLCVTNAEVNAMTTELQQGKNVMMETITDGTTSVEQLSGNGMRIHQTVSGPVACMDLGNGMSKCFFPSPECTDTNSSGRRLTDAERKERALADPGGGLGDCGDDRRRLDPNGGLCDDGDGNSCTCECSLPSYAPAEVLESMIKTCCAECPCASQCERRYRKLSAPEL